MAGLATVQCSTTIVNQHRIRVFANALLLLVTTAGVQLSQIRDFGRSSAGPSAGNVPGRGTGDGLDLGRADPPRDEHLHDPRAPQLTARRALATAPGPYEQASSVSKT